MISQKISQKTFPTVVLVGRTNVGKSTLFNRITGSYKAIVSAKKNTTRDRNVTQAYWRGRVFDLIDTGGLDIDQSDALGSEILEQANIALKNADVILFLVDAQVGILPEDRKIAKLLRAYQKKIIIVVNKLDKPGDRQGQAGEFFKLGFGQPFAVSAITGGGTGELLDVVVDRLAAKKTERKEKISPEESVITVAIVGKPNVGKSSLLNAILSEKRVIVSDIPHTTREPIHTELTYKGQNFIIMDTAGIRKRTKIPDLSTKKGIDQTLRAIEGADVVFFMLEAQERITSQDARVAAEILECGASIIMVINKWDLIKNKQANTIKEFESYFRAKFPYLKWVPMIFISAVDRQRTYKTLELAQEIYRERIKMIDAKKLDNFFTKTIKRHRPPKDSNGKRIYVYGISQVQTNPPLFEMRRKGKSKMHEAYVRFIENQIRENFGFMGTPIRVKVRSIA